MNVKITFGNNLHLYRKQQNLSQEQLAEKLGISVKHLSTMETGKCFVSAELLERICQSLNISPAALFYSIEDKSCDDSDITAIDSIIEEELHNSFLKMKTKIHQFKLK